MPQTGCAQLLVVIDKPGIFIDEQRLDNTTRRLYSVFIGRAVTVLLASFLGTYEDMRLYLEQLVRVKVKIPVVNAVWESLRLQQTGI